MSDRTKRVLSLSLKALLGRMPLNKITIQNLVDEAGVSRKTFYYHFQDIYDLLEWTLVDTGSQLLKGRTTAKTWQQGVRAIFLYFEENRAAILNIYRCLQENDPILEQYISRLVYPILEDIFDAQPGCERVGSEDRAFILELYAHGILMLFLYWISKGMQPDAEQMCRRIDRLFNGSMESMIQRCVQG